MLVCFVGDTDIATWASPVLRDTVSLKRAGTPVMCPIKKDVLDDLR